MSSETIHRAPRRQNVQKIRTHAYLYDTAFVVSGARDYARAAFKAAMTSAQLVIQPVYNTMFSELRQFPRAHVVYHPNCRLPQHLDRSYATYVHRVQIADSTPAPQFSGKDSFKFIAMPKKVFPLKTVSPEFQAPTPVSPDHVARSVNRGIQTVYRESSAQTQPWQPDAVAAIDCENTPEVLHLDKLEWGPGDPYRIGDLPADFHTTEIINKMRHARTWQGLIETAKFPRWMKKGDAIISDVETKDWIFREAEIDELQEIRLSLLHRLQSEQRSKKNVKTAKKLSQLWQVKKSVMEKRIAAIHHNRDRELRKLAAGRLGAKSASMSVTKKEPSKSNLPEKHARITYSAGLLSAEDHEKAAALPPWLDRCAQDLTRSCSGHHLPRDETKLCERETKWSEKFLERLHDDLKKARIGAACVTSVPIHILKPRMMSVVPECTTPELEAVTDDEEACHQAALMLQRIVKGRAVQNLMYEGRRRSGELILELKSTHGLEQRDKARIAHEDVKARNAYAMMRQAEKKEQVISSLVQELCSEAVAKALDYLEKELRRLKAERKQHAFLLIALRERTMREAAEAGRRQKEERRRLEHDEMFKQMLGVTNQTVDDYFRAIVKEATEECAEREGVRRGQALADEVDRANVGHEHVSTADQHELVAELVHQFLLPEAYKAGTRAHIQAAQTSRLTMVRDQIFGEVDRVDPPPPVYCSRCNLPFSECRCKICPMPMRPVEKPEYRDDPRWKHTKSRPVVVKDIGDRYPLYIDLRCMLNTLIDEVVIKSRDRRQELSEVNLDVGQLLRENVELALDARDFVDQALDVATGVVVPPVKKAVYHHYMKHEKKDALERTEPYTRSMIPKELPSEIRRKAEEDKASDNTCYCSEAIPEQTDIAPTKITDSTKLLPTELRVLEELKRCKCDISNKSDSDDPNLNISYSTSRTDVPDF